MNRIKKISDLNKFIIITTLLTFYTVFSLTPYLTLDSLAWTQTGLSYKYGFIARALVGTLYQLLDHISPTNLMQYNMLKSFTLFFISIFIIFVLTLLYICITNINNTIRNRYIYLSIVFCIFLLPTYMSHNFLGKYDYILLFLTLINCVAIITERNTWITIPNSLLCILIHEGYVFMFANITLVLLLFKFLESLQQKKSFEKTSRKYLILFLSCFLIDSIMFLYFQFFTKPVDEAIFNDACRTATSLSPNNTILIQFFQQNLMKINYIEQNNIDFVSKVKELIIFVLYMLPYEILFIHFIIKFFRASMSKIEVLKYTTLLAGSLTILPEFILKEDYGRWILCVIIYYFVILSCLLYNHDQHLNDALVESFSFAYKLSNPVKLTLLLALVLYPLIFVPLGSFYISIFTYMFVL